MRTYFTSNRQQIADDILSEHQNFAPRKNMPWRNEPLALKAHEMRMEELFDAFERA